MLMAISFPDTVSPATQISYAPARLNSASSAKSQVVSTDHECGACSAQRSRKSTDEDFDAVLAWMITGIVPQVQPPAVAESTDSPLTSDSVVTDAAETASSIGFGPATAQIETTSKGIASTTTESQRELNITDDFTSAGPAGLGNLEPPTTTAVTADQSLNDAATPIRSQFVRVSSNPQSIEGFEFLPTEPMLSSPAVGAVAAIPEVQTTAFNRPVEAHFDLSAAPEALSQDAIDALDRIGRLPGSVISQAPSSAVPENKPTVSASPIYVSSISPLPVSVSSVDAKLVSEVPGSEPPISTTRSSVVTESNELKAPVPASVPATSVLPAATLPLSSLPPSTLPVAATSSVTTVSAKALPATNASMTSTSVTANSENDAGGRRKAPIEVTSDQALASNSKSVVQPSTVADAFKMIESMNQPVRGRTSFASALPVLDKSEFFIGREPHAAAAAPSYDVVRSDLLQPNVTNSLPDLATSISSEMRQPLSNQVSQAIMEHIERNGVRSNDTFSVRLDPPELGEMTIELSKTNEGLAVRVTAREAVTMDMLFVRGKEIESHLRGQQMNLKSLEFLRADMSGNQFSQGQQQNDASRRSENLINQVRRGSRSSSPANTNVGRITTPDSSYGLSFRA